MKSLLFIPLFIFSLQAQTQKGYDTPPPPNIVLAVKANSFVWQMPQYAAKTVTAYGVDYSYLVQCAKMGLFIGYTPLYSQSANYKSVAPLNCINFGLQYQLTSLNKKNAFILCLYNVHTKQSNDNFPAQKSNFINLNPRYQLSFCKHLLLLEFGLLAGIDAQKNINGSFYIGTHGSSARGYTINTHYGFNIGLAFNFAPLIYK